MKRRNKIIAALLLLCMLVGMLPLQAVAVSASVSIGETGYDTLAAALQAAVAEDTVVLNADVTESYVTVKPGVTLDLSGHVLSAEYVIGLKGSAVIDSSEDNSGKVVAAQDCVALDQTNGSYFPVYEENGFVFTTVKLAGRSKFVSVAKFLFSPVFESFAHDALASGEAASGARVMVRLSWSNEGDGNYRAQQDFAYLDKLVKSVVGSYNGSNYAKAFAADFGGSEAGLIDRVTAVAVLSSVTGVELTGESAIAPTAEDAMKELLENKTKLRFNEDGDFKVMVLADLHAKLGGLTETQQGYVKTMVDREQPDLVILTGDNVRSLDSAPFADEAAMRVVLDSAVGYLEKKGIYWMHVYGNHDDENNPLDKETQQAIYESYEYCLSKDVEELYGVGNYVIPLYGSDESSDEIKFAFWGLDSGTYMSEEDKALLFPDGQSVYVDYKSVNYDYIHYDQIKWYENTSEQLEAYAGAKVPGLMAFHIPIQEYYTAWVNREGTEWSGDKNEVVGSSAYNSGLFEVMRNRGDIKAVVCGHDHKNTFMVKFAGIKLCYSPTISTNSYYDEKEMGCRVFTLSEEDPADVDTYMSYLNERPDYTKAEPIADGYTYDFEGEAPTITKTGNGGWTSANINDISASVKEGVGKDGSKGLAVMRTSWDTESLGKNSIQLIWDIPFGKVGENKYLAVWVDFAKNDAELRIGCFGVVVDGNYSTHYEMDANDTITDYYVKAEDASSWTTMQTNKDGCMVSLKGFKGWIAVPLDELRQVGTGASLTSDSVITGLLVFNAPNYEANINKEFYYDDFTFVKDYKTVSPETTPTVTKTVVTDFEGTSLTVSDITATGNAGNKAAHLDTIGLEIKNGMGRNGSKGLAVKRTAWDSTAGNIGYNSIQLIWDIEPMKKGDNEYLAVWVDFAKNDAELRLGCFGVIVDDNYTNHYEMDAYDKVIEYYTKAEGATEWTTRQTNSDGCMVSLKGFKGWIAVPLSSMEKFKNQEQFLTADSNITGILVFNAPNYEAQVGKEFYYDDFTFVKDYNDIV